jgi:hypothetical protein
LIIEILFLVLAIPTGLLIAHLTKEELKQGKKYFRALIILSVLATVWFYLTKFPAEALTSAFIAITTIISYTKA